MEQIQALEVLAGEPSQECTLNAEQALVVGEGRPQKGKPLPKGKLQQLLRDTAGFKIVLTGPDYVGVTTVLR